MAAKITGAASFRNQKDLCQFIGLQEWRPQLPHRHHRHRGHHRHQGNHSYNWDTTCYLQINADNASFLILKPRNNGIRADADRFYRYVALKDLELPPSPLPDAITTFLQLLLALFTPVSVPNMSQPLIL